MVGSDIDRKSRLGQGRAGLRRKIKALTSRNTGPGSSESKPIIINNEAVSAVDIISSRPKPEISRSEVLPPYLLPQKQTSSKTPRYINKEAGCD